MSELLGFPQMVLLLAPVLLRIIWLVARASLERMAPSGRAAVLFTLIVLPVAAIGVPYFPGLAPYLPLPWRPPLAWGFANVPALGDPLASVLLELVAAALIVVPPCALIVLAVRASRAAHLLSLGLGGAPHRAGFVLAPGRSIACAIGLWRPRVVLSADVWAGEHGRVVLAHERAHVRGRHSLLVLLAHASLVLWWWIPGTRRLLDDFRQALEESADASAARRCGRARVARAILGAAEGALPATALGFGGARSLERRLLALSAEPSIVRTRVLGGVSALAAILWLVFL